MRIIIESTERGGAETPLHESAHLPHAKTMDGGAPSETAMHTIAEALPISTEREGMDAGSPPEWLVEAIQEATLLRTEGSSADTNAGGASSDEG